MLPVPAGPASAEVVIAIDKSIQRMSVTVDGREQHLLEGLDRHRRRAEGRHLSPQRLEKSWFSRKYNMSPMPHAIFFDEGYAIHGTDLSCRGSASRASHGCVRLHPKDAAALFACREDAGQGRHHHRRHQRRLADCEEKAGRPKRP